MAEQLPLGSAVATEFAAIAALLSTNALLGGTSPPAALVSALPPPSAGTPLSPPVLSPAVVAPPIVQAPLSIPPAPQGSAIGAVAGAPPSTAACPLLSPTDYASLINLERQSRGQSTPTVPGYQTPQQQMAALGTTFAVGQYLDYNDTFQFSAFSSTDIVTVSFYGRVQGLDGEIRSFNYQLTTDTAGTVKTVSSQTGPGFLLNAAASIPAGTTLTGSVSALGQIGDIVNGAYVPHTLLFSGQLTATQPLGNSLASPSRAVNNRGYKLISNAGNVANLFTTTITPSTGRQVRLLDVFFQFTATAAVGDREIGFQILIASAFVYAVTASRYVQASEAVAFNATPGGQVANLVSTGLLGDFLSTTFADSLYFSQAATLNVGEINNGPIAGDRVKNILVSYEES
jgi:hypothetical protein